MSENIKSINNLKNIKNIIYSLSSIERKLLPQMLNSIDITKLSELNNLNESEIMTVIQLLEQNKFTVIEKKEEKVIELDKFGKQYISSDLPEIKLLKIIINESKKQSEINLEKDEITAALGILKRNKLLNIKKENEEMIFSITEIKLANEYLKNNLINPLIEFKSKVAIDKLNDKQQQIISNFRMRKGFLKESIIKSFKFTLSKEGESIAKEINLNYKNLDLLENLDRDILKNSSWKNKEFRHYNVNLDTTIQELGRSHPMIEANNILKDIFIEMGFKEMDGPIVESAFWNMDVMWIPQDHPARDEQDTFYLEEKADISKDLISKIKLIHEKGIKRTHTSENGFSEEITKKTLLRTHSTATTFRTLAKLAEKNIKGENINGKYFYIAHNFRNETIDSTHLAEFFQAEGFIIADDLSLADLMGFVKEYYSKLGITQIKFKPTFNPYTEPSMEAHYYDPKLKKWYALINSGIFRTETLKPFGLENKTVIAWGMGASRVAALLSQKESMRDITGITCDLDWLRTRPIMKREIIRK